MTETKRMNHYEAEELLYHLVGHEETEDSDPDEVCYEKYECDFEQFQKIASDLLPMAITATGGLSEKVYYGFADKKNGAFIVKREVSE